MNFHFIEKNKTKYGFIGKMLPIIGVHYEEKTLIENISKLFLWPEHSWYILRQKLFEKQYQYSTQIEKGPSHPEISLAK